MELCQESETDLENSEIKTTEEIEENFTCPDERREKSHVCCLLDISDITLQEDERINEFVVGTGWEEAVHGWGKTSPAACIWPRKKLKKAKAGENSSSSCLLCVSLSQVNPESKSALETGKWETKTVAEPGLEKNWNTSSQIPGPSQVSSTAPRESNNICFPNYIHREKKSLQIKEFIWCLDEWATPEVPSGKAARSPSRGMCPERGFSLSDSLTSKALLVLPPLRASPPNSVEALGKNSKNIYWQSDEKVVKVEKDESVTTGCGLKTVDGTGDKRHFQLTKHLMVTKGTSLTSPPEAPTPLLADSERCCLRWSLLTEKTSMCPPNANSIHYLATLQLLQKGGLQSCRPTLKTKDPRPLRNTQRHVLTKTKQESSPQMLDTKVFPRPLLPSLTPTRLASKPYYRLEMVTSSFGARFPPASCGSWPSQYEVKKKSEFQFIRFRSC
ncbi:PREDICTED: uncharacterized protein C16orf46 homolog isoform X1 [Dipodomys ordii]|uniref:Uncharacterized protein C16orf46 homolog isoform X1 n=1 Tax=Dipodomys ordii TaxID=10020 RepID=A0A1S3EXR9_DIPOR|nr:PREDICTED: uncharacterized protein C16orf46 homolog isoform X1 [Dipodomys ordii]XP_012868243.1 PREDICTED: uncharacterized protein C16orf46 homolog isoform X1 [Dipodomys ordii]